MTTGGTPRGHRPADLDLTKLRLVREAIQHNVQARRLVWPKTETRPRFAFAVVIATSFLIASLIYLSVPSADPARMSSVASARATVGADARDFGVLDPAPRPLSRSVLPLAVRKIVLDPGHGGTQNGAVSTSGVAEKEITLDVGLRLRRLLQDASYEVLMTRETDATLSLERRVALANGSGADLFVSIHVNWIPRRETRPLETYFAGPTDDPATQRLASVENRDSGYSLAAYRRLLEKVYMDSRREESHALAARLNTELYRSLREVNPELENRGVKTAPFAVLIGTEMPAILVEVSCLSNEADVRLLTNADYRDRVAAALLRGIQSYASELGGVGRKEG